jgi:putative phage-type endonuclease
MSQEIKIYTYDQRTPEWYQVRQGKITASDIVNILGKETLATTKNAIDNLAQTLAIESIYGIIEDNFVSFDMQRGIDMEPSAFAVLKSYLGEQFIDCHQIGFAELNEHVGASPDAICSDNKVGEIKCPNAKNYFKYIIDGQVSPKHYAQMQHQMLCTNMDGAYYVNYCVHMGKEYTTIRIIERDAEMIELIKSRCEAVIELKLKYIDRLVSSGDFNVIS